jgi:O-antigen/teichoic acid export membrane protein
MSTVGETPALLAEGLLESELTGAVKTITARIRSLLRHEVVHNAFSLYAIQGLNYLMPLILLPYLLRTLGPRSYGSIVVAQSLMGYATILTDFGFNFTAARDISVARADSAAVSQIYWTVVAAKMCLFAISTVVIAAIVVCTPMFRREWPTFLACSLMVIGNSAFPQWYLQGLERLKDSALIQAGAKVVVALATFSLVKTPGDAWIAAAITSSPLLLGIAIAAALRRSILPERFYRPRRAEILTVLKGSWHMFASSMATTLYGNTNAIVLGLISGDGAVAVYNLAQRLVLAVQGAAVPLTQAVFPRASLLFSRDNAQARRLIGKVVWTILPVIGAISLILGIFAPEVVRLVGGRSYGEAALLVRIMAITPVLIAAGGLPAQIVIVSNGLTRQLSHIYFGVGLINLLLLPPLVIFWAERGAAISLTVAETAAVTLMVVVAWKGRGRSGLVEPRKNLV